MRPEVWRRWMSALWVQEKPPSHMLAITHNVSRQPLQGGLGYQHKPKHPHCRASCECQGLSCVIMGRLSGSALEALVARLGGLVEVGYEVSGCTAGSFRISFCPWHTAFVFANFNYLKRPATGRLNNERTSQSTHAALWGTGWKRMGLMEIRDMSYRIVCVIKHFF